MANESDPATGSRGVDAVGDTYCAMLQQWRGVCSDPPSAFHTKGSAFACKWRRQKSGFNANKQVVEGMCCCIASDLFLACPGTGASCLCLQRVSLHRRRQGAKQAPDS